MTLQASECAGCLYLSCSFVRRCAKEKVSTQVFLEDAASPGRYKKIAERSERPTGAQSPCSCNDVYLLRVIGFCVKHEVGGTHVNLSTKH